MPTSNRYSYRYRGWDFPTLAFVLRSHDLILENFGGEPGLRDRGLVESALDAPIRSAGGEDAYHTFFEKVAALGYLIASFHGFTDGNKRTALATVTQTLEWNGHYLEWGAKTEVMVFSLVGAGHLKAEGLRHALLMGCGLSPSNHTL